MSEPMVPISGPTIETFTGRAFHLLEPRIDEIDIRDIAHALSLLCRFTGHVKHHYSVAQHCWYASMIVPEGFELEALLHDSPEAYVNDLSRPLKHFTEAGKYYREVEHKIESVIRRKFGLPSEMSPEVKIADNTMLYAEKAALMKPCEWSTNWGEHGKINFEIERWTPENAEHAYLWRFRQLTRPDSPGNWV